MKTFATALIGFSLMIGTVMAQTPAPSTSSTDTNSSTKVKKHKKHNSTPATTPALAASSTPAK
jgi:hypothetical protein